ncbi:MAG: hypothetical protein IKO12_04350 [Bacteroidaceae bacterium]|nr:hypothetical protein [Bacteroidaceae bacterium]
MKSLRTWLLLLALLPAVAAWAIGLGQVRVGVVLPLKEKNNRGAKMVEFYQGILLAVDSMRHEGLNIEVQALHSGSTAADMDSLLLTNSLSQCNLIFGPLDAAQLPALADYCDIHSIRLVVPFSTSSTQLIGHPLYYQVNAMQAEVQTYATELIGSVFGKCNYVVAEAENATYEGTSFVAHLKEQLARQDIATHPVAVGADTNAYASALSTSLPNVIVLNTPTIKALNMLVPQLEAFQRNHPESGISLIGYPDWQTYTSQHLAAFHKFNTYVYTTFYRNPLEYRIKNFEQKFMHHFGRPMIQTYPRYSMMGFDLAYYFLRGLQIFGDDLEAHHADVPNYPFQHNFRFERAGEGSGFVNRHIQLIHYTTKQTTEIVTAKP